MKELWEKIREALVSALPITLIVYLIALLPGFSFEGRELGSFTLGAVLLILGIGLFNLGADIAMTPMGTHVGDSVLRSYLENMGHVAGEVALSASHVAGLAMPETETEEQE